MFLKISKGRKMGLLLAYAIWYLLYCLLIMLKLKKSYCENDYDNCDILKIQKDYRNKSLRIKKFNCPKNVTMLKKKKKVHFFCFWFGVKYELNMLLWEPPFIYNFFCEI